MSNFVIFVVWSALIIGEWMVGGCLGSAENGSFLCVSWTCFEEWREDGGPLKLHEPFFIIVWRFKCRKRG